MTELQRKRFLRNSHRRLPAKENPLGVPKAVMKALQWQTLSFDKREYEQRLQELLAAYKLNGGSNGRER
jgi:hypothetical protein